MNDNQRAAERITEALSDPEWHPRRHHIEGARNQLVEAAAEIERLLGVCKDKTELLTVAYEQIERLRALPPLRAREEIARALTPEGWQLVPIDDDRDHVISKLPLSMIFAGGEALEKCQDDLANYKSGETPDWDSGMIAVAIYRAMLAAAPRHEAKRASSVEEIATEIELTFKPLVMGQCISDWSMKLLVDTSRAAADRILSSTAGQEWRDISSAPKDDLEEKLVFSRDGNRHVAIWSTLADDFVDTMSGSALNATLWQPLPAPPVAEPIVADKSEVK